MNLTRKDGADAALKLLIAARGTLYNIDANDIALKVTEAIESIQAEFWPEQLHPATVGSAWHDVVERVWASPHRRDATD